jgi:hypothetical protein
MIITKNIAEKFNKLYREVAVHYGLEDRILSLRTQELDFILIKDLHPSKDDITSSSTKDDILNYLVMYYTYLAPFFEFQHYKDFGYNTTAPTLFYNMNNAIRKIRKENLVTENKN